jgi:hypothetical protein
MVRREWVQVRVAYRPELVASNLTGTQYASEVPKENPASRLLANCVLLVLDEQ